ncbi:HAD-like protein [Wolfiporia cocos MD-104 SS10]|uniref:HAD-like protein n=1 Tax=Wolfiporia cocos (strain MD-104) TaxID=742152 RepID=A0A2H3JH95_WOLCO|nr:HAD-like protein [Wolfiporia cocos MD-104 SS10]
MRYSELLARVHAELEARLHGKAGPPEGGEHAVTMKTTASEAGTTAVGTSASAEAAGGAAEADPHTAFGRSIASWPVFPDTVPALEYLSKHLKLTVLSNVDRASFAATQRALEGPPEAQRFAFAAVYTAEDAGAYKPDPRAREYALRRIEQELGVKREEVLVVANSVFHDVAPSRQIGLGTAWIQRQGSVIGHDEVEGSKATFRFGTLGEMAEALKREVESH